MEVFNPWTLTGYVIWCWLTVRYHSRCAANGWFHDRPLAMLLAAYSMVFVCSPPTLILARRAFTPSL